MIAVVRLENASLGFGPAVVEEITAESQLEVEARLRVDGRLPAGILLRRALPGSEVAPGSRVTIQVETESLVDLAVLDVLRGFARATSNPERSADEVASLVRIRSRGGSYTCAKMTADDALKRLVRDGYVLARRSRTKLYRIDPDDRRPALPSGYRYERRVHSVTRRPYEVVVSTRWTAQGGPAVAFVEGDFVDVDLVSELTYRGGRGGPPLSEAEALAWIASRGAPLVPAGRRLRAPLSDPAAVERLAALVSDVSYGGADVARGTFR